MSSVFEKKTARLAELKASIATTQAEITATEHWLAGFEAASAAVVKPPEGETLTVIAKAERKPRQDVRGAVKAALERYGEGSSADIARRTGLEPQSVSAYLSRAKKSGEVIETNGVYSLPKTTATVSGAHYGEPIAAE